VTVAESLGSARADGEEFAISGRSICASGSGAGVSLGAGDSDGAASVGSIACPGWDVSTISEEDESSSAIVGAIVEITAAKIARDARREATRINLFSELK
jgi:hypothetical protein